MSLIAEDVASNVRAEIARRRRTGRAIIDRLTQEQTRYLAMALAVSRPDVFEQAILEFAAGRWA